MVRRFGLRQRFILFLFSLFVVLFGAIATLLVARTSNSEHTNLNEQTKSFSTLATKPIGDSFVLYKDSGSVRIQQEVTRFTELDPDVRGVTIVDTAGKVQFSSGQKASIPANQAATFEPIYNGQKGTIKEAIVPLIEDYGVHRYTVIYTISDSRLVQTLQRTVDIIILFSIVAFALAILLTYRLISVFFLSPVSTISAKALTISKGDLENQIQLNRNDELGDLATAVNTMANALKADIVKLQEADRLKSEFITISSHNLRTPLTVIKGELELMHSMNTTDQLHGALSSLSSSVVQLDNFIEDLLAISSMESGKLAASDVSAAPLKSLLDAVATDYVNVAAQKHIDFAVSLNLADEQVVMSRHLLKIAIVNLLENAFKFTKEGAIGLNAAIAGQEAVITITDTGIGIAQAELSKLFTKFHRATSIMEYNYEGTGIGLYLTKLILEQHNGTIAIDSVEGKGTTCTIRLPLVLPQAASPQAQPAPAAAQPQ